MGSWGLAAMTAAHPWARGPPMSSLTYMASLPVTAAIVLGSNFRTAAPFLGNSLSDRRRGQSALFSLSGHSFELSCRSWAACTAV